VSAAHCRLRAIVNGDEHRTLRSQSCERVMLTMGTFTFLPLPYNVRSHTLHPLDINGSTCLGIFL